MFDVEAFSKGRTLQGVSRMQNFGILPYYCPLKQKRSRSLLRGKCAKKNCAQNPCIVHNITNLKLTVTRKVRKMPKVRKIISVELSITCYLPLGCQRIFTLLIMVGTLAPKLPPGRQFAKMSKNTKHIHQQHTKLLP
jgi:hypothetical protein